MIKNPVGAKNSSEALPDLRRLLMVVPTQNSECRRNSRISLAFGVLSRDNQRIPIGPDRAPGRMNPLRESRFKSSFNPSCKHARARGLGISVSFGAPARSRGEQTAKRNKATKYNLSQELGTDWKRSRMAFSCGRRSARQEMASDTSPLVPRFRTYWSPGEFVATCHFGLMHRSKQPFYSITSSARPSSGSGTVTPSVLAALRLMNSSTFVTCWTGRSAGLSPLSMRPVWMPA